MPIDLNRLRDVVRQNQSANNPTPTDPTRQVVVDRDGNVRFGSDVARNTPTTQVPQETFASRRIVPWTAA